jgi:hypothetical protein
MILVQTIEIGDILPTMVVLLFKEVLTITAMVVSILMKKEEQLFLLAEIQLYKRITELLQQTLLFQLTKGY